MQFPAVCPARKEHMPDFRGLEGHRPARLNGRAQRLPRVPRDTRGQIYGTDRRAASVHPFDKQSLHALDRPGEADAKQGVHHQIRPSRPALLQFQGLPVADAGRDNPRGDHRLAAGSGVPLPALGESGAPERHRMSQKRQMAGADISVPAVVSSAADNQHMGGLFQLVRHEAGDSGPGILHQHNPGNPLFLHHDPLHLPHLFRIQYALGHVYSLLTFLKLPGQPPAPRGG